jgi:mannitol-1-phosphate 5-dehydrogenase
MNAGLAVVVGGGNVGVGVMLRLLRNAGYDVAMVAHRPWQAQHLQRYGARVQLTGASRARLELDPCTAVAAGERRSINALVRAASLCVVTVRPHQLEGVAALLAPGLSCRRRPMNVLVCDNRPEAGNVLAAAVARASDPATADRHGYVATLLDQIATSCKDEEGRLVHVEAKGRLFLDALALRADPPMLAGSLLVEDHPAYVQRKLFLFSAGHAATAFLGRLRGHTLIREALNDPLVAEVVLLALKEARAGLEHRFGHHLIGGEHTVHDYVARYGDPDLPDTVERVGRDAGRKLVGDDRVCGPASLAIASGISAPALALVGAACLWAYETELGGGWPCRRSVSPAAGAALMAQVSGLRPGHPFVKSTGAAYAALSSGDLAGVAQQMLFSTSDVSSFEDAHNETNRDGTRE